MTKHGTTFLESELILAAQEHDADTMVRLIAEMLPGERFQLVRACERLIEALEGTDDD